MAADVENLLKKQKLTEQLLSDLDKHKETEILTQQLISNLSADAKLLTEKIASNQFKPQEIGEKITTVISSTFVRYKNIHIKL